jgi:competence protein ComEA
MKWLSLLLLVVTFSFGAVDINKANKAELMTLSGVGEVKANAILEYRKKHNCFGKVDEIKEVKGLGEKFLQKNRINMTVSGCKK